MSIELPNEKKLSLIRRYPIETLVFFLLCALAFLTGWQYQTSKKVNELQDSMKTYLYADRETLIKTVERNTESNIRVVETIRDFKDLIKK